MALFVPTYNGQAIFGVSYTIAVVGYPHELAIGAFPGVHGRFAVRQGSRGFFADAQILQTAADAGTLGVFEDVWNTYRNTAYSAVLYDTTGRSWPYAVATEFRPLDRILPHRSGGVAREYAIHFEIMR